MSLYSHVDRSQMSSEPKAYTRILNDGVETVPVSAIKTHPRNPRRGDLDAVSSSISVNGFYGSSPRLLPSEPIDTTTQAMEAS